jgi:parvulin-like peptidyl-prolyl isomerase
VSGRVRCIAALGAVFFAVAGLVACGGIPSNAVVQVDGTPITKATFTHWQKVALASAAAAGGAVLPDPPKYKACIAHLRATQPKPAKGQPAPTEAELKRQCEQQRKALTQEVLGFLISAQWVIGEAEHLGVKATDKEVKKKFEALKNQQFSKPEQFQKFLSQSGQSVSDLLLRVKLNLLSSKIQAKIAKEKGKITKAQIAEFYNHHKEQFGKPESRDVRVILTKTEAQAKKAKHEVQAGKSFASVAKAVSIDPASKAKGGELGAVAKGQQEKALDSAIFSAKLNTLGGPVKTPFGYYVYEVKRVIPGSQRSLAQSEATIKQQLTATHQQESLSKFVEKFKKRWKAKTDCRAGYVVQDCKQYKAPKGATGTTGTTGAPATGATGR